MELNRKKERRRNFSILNFVFVISREKYLSRFKAVTLVQLHDSFEFGRNSGGDGDFSGKA